MIIVIAVMAGTSLELDISRHHCLGVMVVMAVMGVIAMMEFAQGLFIFVFVLRSVHGQVTTGMTTVIEREMEVFVFFILHSMVHGLAMIRVTTIIGHHELALIAFTSVMTCMADLVLHRLRHGQAMMVVTAVIVWKIFMKWGFCFINPPWVGKIILRRITSCWVTRERWGWQAVK